jgi:hypothetical protein
MRQEMFYGGGAHGYTDYPRSNSRDEGRRAGASQKSLPGPPA